MFYTSLLVLATAVGASNVPLYMLSDPKARCMDGTQSGYYYEPNATENGGSKWIIHLQGGGECTTKEACYGELDSALGSSKYFSATMGLGYLNRDDSASNPDWWDNHHVLIPYCTGDLHSGTITTPSEDTFDLYFSGHLVLEAVLDELTSLHGLADATDIILSGDSAGGIGVWMNVDYLAERFPAARVTAAPFAGFYFYASYPYQGPDHTSSSLANFSESGMKDAYYLYQAYVDKSCESARADDPWACMMATYSYPHIASRSFISEAQTDKVVLEAHDWVPSAPYVCNNTERAYVTAWHARMLSALQQTISADSGVFAPACYIHTDFYPDKPLIQDMSYMTAIGNWYFDRTDSSGYQLLDDCGIWCNPTCTSPC